MRIGTFTHRQWTLSYEEHGEGPRLTVLVHGLLLDAGINRQLAESLAREGHRVVLLDVLGHGLSDKPRRASVHRMDHYADMVISLLDALGAEEAIVGGVSLGSGIGLMTAHRHPERVRGLVLEMPVLEHATPFAAMLFVPVLLAMHYGGPLARGGTRLLGRLPRTGVDYVDSFLNAGSMHPVEITSVLHGLLMGPLSPSEEERMAITAPSLVIAHRADPLHPQSDADRLARQLPNGRLLKATSALELRRHPKRLTKEIVAFLDRTWAARVVEGGSSETA